MSKKSKRQSRKSTAPVSTAVSSSVTPRTPLSTGGARVFEREFNPDYAPVIKDLKRIGMLAGSFFVVLIVLSFFLR